MVIELRCCAPHPDPRRWAQGWNCNAKLTHVVPGSVQIVTGDPANPPPGCIPLKCSRCGAEYVACPVREVA